MKILVLGGTQFVGKHIVEAMAEAGHSLSLFNPGSALPKCRCTEVPGEDRAG